MPIGYFIFNGYYRLTKPVHNRGSVVDYVQILFCHYDFGKKHKTLKAE